MGKLVFNVTVIAGEILVTPALANNNHVDAELASQSPPAGARACEDPRLLKLQKFFADTDAPARALSHVFLSEADQYDLDWRLLPSISFVESTGGKAARNNNMFGWDS